MHGLPDSPATAIVMAQAGPPSGEAGVRDGRAGLRAAGLHPRDPHEEARRYDALAVPVLLAMLRDPMEEEFWVNVAVLLGSIGDERAVEPMISLIQSMRARPPCRLRDTGRRRVP